MANHLSLREPLEALVDMLKTYVDMDLWMFTRVLEDDWIIVAASDNNYGVNSGDVLPWRESVCSRMVNDEGPNIVPDILEELSYKEAPIVKKLPISAYIGFPISNENDELLGTLCAIDQSNKADSIRETNAHIQSLLKVAHTIINQHDTILRLQNAIEKLTDQSDIDDTTGLPNQDAFFELAKQFKQKYDPLGATIAVLIIDIGGLALKSKSSELTYEDLLRSISVDLSKLIRPTDTLCRLDGSRFAALMINVDTRFVSATVMNISKQLEHYKLKISIGADVCREGQSIDDSIEHANNNKMI